MGQVAANLTWDPFELNSHHKTKTCQVQLHNILLSYYYWSGCFHWFIVQRPKPSKKATLSIKTNAKTHINSSGYPLRSPQSHLPGDNTLVQELSHKDDITLNDITPIQDQDDFTPALQTALPRTSKPSFQ